MYFLPVVPVVDDDQLDTNACEIVFHKLSAQTVIDTWVKTSSNRDTKTERSTPTSN
jgi:hypothetical protein